MAGEEECTKNRLNFVLLEALCTLLENRGYRFTLKWLPTGILNFALKQMKSVDKNIFHRRSFTSHSLTGRCQVAEECNDNSGSVMRTGPVLLPRCLSDHTLPAIISHTGDSW